MELKLKSNLSKVILIIMTIGIWVVVLQNAGIIPTKNIVYVKGGYIEADVSGSVYVSGSVDVSGSVSIDNEVDVNLSSVNGHSNAFYGPGRSGTYDAIHVYTGQ